MISSIAIIQSPRRRMRGVIPFSRWDYAQDRHYHSDGRTDNEIASKAILPSLHVWPDILAAWQIDLKRYGFRFGKGLRSPSPSLDLTRDMFSKVAIDNEVEFTSVLLCRRRIRLMGYQ